MTVPRRLITRHVGGGAGGGSSSGAAPYLGPTLSGRYLLPGTVTTQTAVAGYRTWLPMWIGYTGTVNALNIEVTTLAAGFCRVGMYSDAAGVPDALLADGGALDCSSTGIKTAAVSVAVTPDLYWFVGWVTGVAPSFRVCTNTLLNAAPTFPQASLNPGSSHASCFRESGLTVDGSLPATAPSVTATIDRFAIIVAPSFA